MYYQIKYLSEYFNIYLWTIVDGNISVSDRQELEQYVKDIKVVTLPKFKRYWNVLRAYMNDHPMSVGYYYDRGLQKELSIYIKEHDIDHVYCQLTRMAEYVRDIQLPKTIDYMDAFGIGMQKRSEIRSGIERWLYQRESERMLKYERSIYSDFDHHTIISSQDRSLLPVDTNAISVVENGVDLEFFSPKEHQASYDIGYIGNMGYLPNVEAAKYLADAILPLESSWQLLIAGARPHEEVRRLASDRVHVSGWMEDIRDAYTDIRILVAPIWSGTGQQNKILEAMAMGVPCVTTEIVNDAIGAEPDLEICVANDAASFKEKIQYLLNNEKVYQEMSKRARKFVIQHYSWQRAVLKLINIIKLN